MTGVLLLAADMDPRQGGPPKVVYGSACALARAGVSVEIATTGAVETADATRAAWPLLAELGIPLQVFPRTGPATLGYSAGMDRFLTREVRRFDAVHVHGVWEQCFARATRRARAAGVRTFVSPHGMLDRWQLRQSRLKKQVALRLFGTGAMLSRADAVLYGTRHEADEARTLALPSPALVMPNGVEPEPLADRAAVTAKLHARFPQMRSWSRTVLFLSRLHPKKGLDLLVEAFARTRQTHPGAGLLAVAIPQDAEYEATLRKRIGEIGPERIVLVTDLVGPEARTALAAADVFCLPSHQEGLSIAILEAMGAGLPVLITTECHLDELEERGAAKVVPDTVAGLTAGLAALLDLDRESLAAMGRRGASIVASEYSWERIAADLAALYAGESAR
jgi:glycosyltransferase involved in cell wall biosynthesis